MKTFYRIDELSNQIVELTDDDIIDDICRMRTHGGKDNQFYNWVREYLINTFWEWQCQYPMEVDPAFRIFDCVEDAQEKQRENRLTDKLNEEIKEYLETEEKTNKPPMAGLDYLLSPESCADKLKKAQEFIDSNAEKLSKEIYESNFKDFLKD